MEDAKNRLAEMGRELDQVPDCTAEREAALKEKRALLREAGGAAGERIAALEEELAARQSRKEELGEVIDAGQEVFSCLYEAIRELREGEDTFTTRMKQHALDETRNYVDQAQRLLSRFRTEPADADLSSRAQVSIEAFAAFPGYFLSDSFDDMALLKQIGQSGESVIRAVHEVERILDQLEDLDYQEEVGISRAQDALTQVTETG